MNGKKQGSLLRTQLARGEATCSTQITFILPAYCLKNPAPFSLVKLWFRFSLSHVSPTEASSSWFQQIYFLSHLTHCSKNYLADLPPQLYFHVLCIPHLPLSSPNASNKLCTLLLPTSLKAYAGQYLLAADREDKRWLSSCWCSPILLLPLLSHSFCK